LDLILLRHGEAGNRVPAASKDYERSLTASGKSAVEEIAKSIESLKLGIDCLASSPLARALETARIVAKELGKTKELEVWDELKPESDIEELYSRLRRFKMESSVLLVGHEPYLGFLISDLISGSPRARVALKKAGMAKLVVSSLTPRATGELRWLLTPKQIRNLS